MYAAVLKTIVIGAISAMFLSGCGDTSSPPVTDSTGRMTFTNMQIIGKNQDVLVGEVIVPQGAKSASLTAMLSVTKAGVGLRTLRIWQNGAKVAEHATFILGTPVDTGYTGDLLEADVADLPIQGGDKLTLTVNQDSTGGLYLLANESWGVVQYKF